MEKTHKMTGEKRMVITEHYIGYLWMMKDLKENNGKPILSHKSLVPSDDAQIIPPLTVQDLNGDEQKIPDYFSRNSRNVNSSGCTLLAISFKQHGFEMLPGWIDPFEEAFRGEERDVKVTKLSITEGGFIYKLLKGSITRKFKTDTPENEHANTWLYFGYPDNFKDALRMHNTLTAYYILLDRVGRVRWMGSGEASEEELNVLIQCAKDLAPKKNALRKGNKIRRGRN